MAPHQHRTPCTKNQDQCWNRNSPPRVFRPQPGPPVLCLSTGADRTPPPGPITRPGVLGHPSQPAWYSHCTSRLDYGEQTSHPNLPFWRSPAAQWNSRREPHQAPPPKGINHPISEAAHENTPVREEGPPEIQRVGLVKSGGDRAAERDFQGSFITGEGLRA